MQFWHLTYPYELGRLYAEHLHTFEIKRIYKFYEIKHLTKIMCGKGVKTQDDFLHFIQKHKNEVVN